jgi:hypothetical protein
MNYTILLNTIQYYTHLYTIPKFKGHTEISVLSRLYLLPVIQSVYLTKNGPQHGRVKPHGHWGEDAIAALHLHSPRSDNSN